MKTPGIRFAGSEQRGRRAAALAAVLLLCGCGPAHKSRAIPEELKGTLALGTPAVVLQNATVPGGGGKVVVDRAGDPLNGMAVEAPTGSLPGGCSFTVTSTPITDGPSGRRLLLLGLTGRRPGW